MAKYGIETPNFRVGIPTDKEFAECLNSPHILALGEGEKVYDGQTQSW